VFGGHTPAGFDCSGLVTYVLHHDLGVTLPSNTHTVTTQFYIWKGATTVRSGQALRGDLVCWASHIGIYLGNGQMIHAPQTGEVVKISAVWNTPAPIYRRVLAPDSTPIQSFGPAGG
jgi:cell wall-associated NlpC family hydrolase